MVFFLKWLFLSGGHWNEWLINAWLEFWEVTFFKCPCWCADAWSSELHHLSLIFQVCTTVTVQLSSHFCFPPLNWISFVCARAGKGDSWYLMIVTHKYSIWYKLGEAEKLIEDFFLWLLLQGGGVVYGAFESDVCSRSLFLENDLTEVNTFISLWSSTLKFNSLSGLLNILILWFCKIKTGGCQAASIYL